MALERGRWLLVCAACCVLAAGGVWAAGGAEPGAAATGPARIEYLEGEVRVDGQAASIGQEVSAGSTVRTAANAYCEIVFGSQNIFRIDADSVVVVGELAGRGSIDLRQGALGAVFHKLQRLGKGTETVQVRTPVALAGVRGTAFFIKVESPSSTYVCTCNGALRLADNREGNRRLVRSDSHKALRFTATAKGVRVTAAGLLYHDNASIDALAAKIGVRIPWGSDADESY